MKKNIRQHKKGVSLVIISLSLITFLTLASLVVDTGMAMNAQSELQKATDTAALAAASSLEPSTSGGITRIDSSKASSVATEIFNLSKTGLLKDAKIESNDIKADSKAVHLKTSAIIPTYFLKFAYVGYLTVEAQSTAISAPFYLSKDLPTEPTIGSLLAATTADTDLREPLGDNKNSSYDSSNNIKDQNIYGPPDNKVLSLGPGGYLTVRFPEPLIDGDGADLFIKEAGNLEGYFVFAGNDIDPAKPYINESDQGSGIEWVNISCTGSSPDSVSPYTGAYYTTVDHKNVGSTREAKFYGTGYFDLGATCLDGGSSSYGHLMSARYLKIIDDNAEDGFMANETSVPTLLMGEHSSVTPGADIDSVAIMHHARLISYLDFKTDTDNDGLIDVLELLLGTNNQNADTDGDGIADNLEYSGWYYSGAIPASIIGVGGGNVFFTSPTKTSANGKESMIFE